METLKAMATRKSVREFTDEGITFEDIKKILTTIKVRGRVEMIPISNEFTLMIDYAHNAMAMESLYSALKV